MKGLYAQSFKRKTSPTKKALLFVILITCAILGLRSWLNDVIRPTNALSQQKQNSLVPKQPITISNNGAFQNAVEFIKNSQNELLSKLSAESESLLHKSYVTKSKRVKKKKLTKKIALKTQPKKRLSLSKSIKKSDFKKVKLKLNINSIFSKKGILQLKNDQIRRLIAGEERKLREKLKY